MRYCYRCPPLLIAATGGPAACRLPVQRTPPHARDGLHCAESLRGINVLLTHTPGSQQRQTQLGHGCTHGATQAHEKSLDTTLVRTIVATDAMARICQGS